MSINRKAIDEKVEQSLRLQVFEFEKLNEIDIVSTCMYSSLYRQT